MAVPRVVLAAALVGFALRAAPAHACPVPPPMVALDIPGFYDDPQRYGLAIAPLHAFMEQVNRAADADDRACLLSLLAGWARAGALLGPSSGYQGDFERSWAGADFALALLRFGGAGPREQAMATIDPWLARIAEATRDSETINRLHNNLVYWAGLDLAAIGTVTGRRDLIDAGIARAREGIRDIGPHGELIREIKRGERALHYHNFALIPLIFTAELARRRGIDLYAESHGAIRRLADLVIRAVRDPRSFAAITPVPQRVFPWTFTSDLAWMEPYYARFGDPRLAPLIRARRPFVNLRLGGDVTAAWGAPPAP